MKKLSNWEAAFCKQVLATPRNSMVKPEPRVAVALRRICAEAVRTCPGMREHRVKIVRYTVKDLSRQVDTDLPAVVLGRYPKEEAAVVNMDHIPHLWLRPRFRILFARRCSVKQELPPAYLQKNPGFLRQELRKMVQNLVKPLLDQVVNIADEMTVDAHWQLAVFEQPQAYFWKLPTRLSFHCRGALAVVVQGMRTPQAAK